MIEQLLDQPVRRFLDELASAAPAPGGGSIAALSGAMAAGLLTMVCDLTIGKKQYAEFDDEMRALRERSEALRADGIKVEMALDPSEKLGKQFKHADRRGIPFALVLGPDDLARGEVAIKNLRTGEQRSVARAAVAAVLQGL